MKKLIPLILLLGFAATTQATDPVNSNVAVVTNGFVASTTHPIPVTGIAGSGFTAGAIIPSIIQRYGGHIWWVDSDLGADNAGCGSAVAAPCATVQYTHDHKVTADRGDVVMIANGTLYTEALVLSKNSTAYIAYGAITGSPIDAIVDLYNPSGTNLTLTASYNYFQSLQFETDRAYTNAVYLTNGNNVFYNCGASNDFVNNNASTVVFDGSRSNAWLNGYIIGGKYGVEFRGSVGGNTIRGVTFRDNLLADIVASGTAAFTANTVALADNWHLDQDKSSYIDVGGALSGFITVARSTFNVTTPSLARSQLGGLSKLVMKGNSPLGDTDSPVNTDNSGATAATASNIVTGGVTAFTALGNLDIDSISTQADSTTITGCTDIQFVGNETTGATTLAEETRGNLSPTKTKNLSAGTVVPLVTPFTLSDGKTIVLKATGSNCTSAGLLKTVVKATRRQPYAMLTVGAAATSTATATATASATPTATPTP